MTETAGLRAATHDRYNQAIRAIFGQAKFLDQSNILEHASL